MTRSRQFRNRKGINGGCRSTGHARQIAKQEHRKEWFMPPIKLRAWFGEQNGPLWGPCSLATRWLSCQKAKPGLLVYFDDLASGFRRACAQEYFDRLIEERGI